MGLMGCCYKRVNHESTTASCLAPHVYCTTSNLELVMCVWAHSFGTCFPFVLRVCVLFLCDSGQVSLEPLTQDSHRKTRTAIEPVSVSFKS